MNDDDRQGRPEEGIPDHTSIHVQRAIQGERESVAWAHFQPLVEAQVRLRIGRYGGDQDVEDLVAELWLVVLLAPGRAPAARRTPRAGQEGHALGKAMPSSTFEQRPLNRVEEQSLQDRRRHGPRKRVPPGVSLLPL